MAAVNSKKIDEIDGYVLSDETLSDDDSGDGESEENYLDVSDLEVLTQPSSPIEGKSLKRKIFQFKEYDTGKVYRVEGNVQFSEPWWAATIHVLKYSSSSNKYLVNTPSYRVRCDEDVTKDRVLLLLMRACKVNDQHVSAFTDFLREYHLEARLDFHNFPGLLQEFAETSEDNSSIATVIGRQIELGPGYHVWQCLRLGKLYDYLPQLLPRQFINIMESHTEKFPALEESLESEPWVFGFSRMLSLRHGMFGCEAHLQLFHNCGLISQFPVHIQDALHVYDVLKKVIRKGGHTFINRSWLQSCKKFDGYRVRNWRMAFQFLSDNDIIVQENRNGKDRIYLFREWKAESGISDGIQTMFVNHQTDPFRFDLDFERSEYASIRNDVDQLHACKLIHDRPVVVLSGKGGCGKTTVVSVVFRSVERQIRERHQKEFQMQMFADADVDDVTLTQMAEEVEQSLQEDIPRHKELACNEKLNPGTNCSSGAPAGAVSSDQLQEETDALDGKSRNDDTLPTVLLVAPTGRAATHLSSKSGLPAFTLHQVLYSYWFWKINAECNEDTKWKFSAVQVLVIDECSLVSVVNFHALFSTLLSEANLKKVVLLGDVNQLPSIEPGNFLVDMYSALLVYDCCVTLRQNHRSEAELIVENAGHIAEQKMPVFDKSRHFVQVDLDGLSHSAYKNSDIGMEQDQAIQELLANDSNLESDRRSQFIAFRRQDCAAINEICCKHYSKHTTRNAKNKLYFAVGDKVCCTRNVIVKDEDIQMRNTKRETKQKHRRNITTASPADNSGLDKDSSECHSNRTSDFMKDQNRRLCNGEIFFIKEDVTQMETNGTRHILVLEDEAGSLISVDYKTLIKCCKLQHAWARTIHTYQGSESDVIVYVVGKPEGQTWQHVYTAVTRARQKVFIITRPSYLEKAILTKPKYRYTRLCERVAESLKGLLVEGEHRMNSKTKKSIEMLKASMNRVDSCQTQPSVMNENHSPDYGVPERVSTSCTKTRASGLLEEPSIGERSSIGSLKESAASPGNGHPGFVYENCKTPQKRAASSPPRDQVRQKCLGVGIDVDASPVRRSLSKFSITDSSLELPETENE